MKITGKRKFGLVCVLGLGMLACFCGMGEAAEKPNVIVIMADDLGFGDVSYNGARGVKTPHIDRLAARGLQFSQGYCSASTCTPTRFSFLTGMYAFRQPGAGIAPPNATALVQPGTETIASLMKKAGYATAVVGKWHLGQRPTSLGLGRQRSNRNYLGTSMFCIVFAQNRPISPD